MATPTGTGRTRFDFTDATVIGNVASGPASGGGSDELLVRLVDDQFQDLMKAIQAGPPKSPVMTVNIASTQFSALMASLSKSGPTPGVSVVSLVPSQIAAILSGMNALIKGGGTPVSLASRYVAMVPNQLSALLDAIGAAKATTPPRTPPAPTRLPTPSWVQVLQQINTGGLLKPTGAIGGLAGGKIGLAVEAANAVTDLLVKPFKFAADAVQTFGEAARKVASNDGIGFMTTGLNAASDALGKIPVVGKVFSAGLDLASAGLTTFKSVLDAFTARGRELAKYNPHIAVAAAFADVRRIFADMREANQNAAKYADLITKSQQLDEKFQKALQPLKEAVMKLLIKIMPAIQNIAEGIGKLIAYFTGGSSGNLDQLLESLSDEQLTEAAKTKQDTKEIMQKILEEIQKRRMEKDMSDAIPKMFQNALDRISLEGPGVVRDKQNDRLNFPLL